MTVQTMKSNNKYSLVKGTYASEEAREILMSLVAATIRFHSIASLSSWERKETQDEHSEKRIEELSEMRERILKMIRGFGGENVSVEINAEIKVAAGKT